jgi:signal transduction histidine kinase
MPVGLEVYDSSGMLVERNNFAMKMLGLRSRDPAIEKHTNIFENGYIPERKRKALRGGENIRHEFHYQPTLFDNNSRSARARAEYVGITVAPITNPEGEVANYIAILTDMTDKRFADAQIRAFEKIFDMVARFSEVGFFRVNILVPDKEMYVTDQWYANLNISKSGPLTTSNLIPDTIHTDDAALMLDFIGKAIETTAANHRYIETRVRNVDGSFKWLRWSMMIVERDVKAGRVILCGMNIDITATKDIESTLVEARNKAEESDRLKSAFITNMSHEIRTPLNSIVGFADLIASQADSDELREYAEVIKQNNQKLLELFSDIFDLARIEAGAFDIASIPAEMNSMCAELSGKYAARAKPGVKVDYSRSRRGCLIMTDQMMLARILEILLSNAVKFTDEGSIELGYELLSLDGQPWIEFSVHDTGIGMNPEQIRRCFERFCKADDFSQGLGLGLHIGRSLAYRLGGDITVESSLGGGSCFRLRIPAPAVDGRHSLDSRMNIDLLDGQKPVIVIAEDMKINYELLSKLLEKDYTVIVGNYVITKPIDPQQLLRIVHRFIAGDTYLPEEEQERFEELLAVSC